MSYINALIDFIIVFISSILIGFIIGIITALVYIISFTIIQFLFVKQILKYKNLDPNPNSFFTYDSTKIETTIILIVPWVTYLIAEGFGMSGIVSIIFCGISMARYAIPNLGPDGRKLTSSFYHSLAYNFENSVFIFIGVGFVGFNLNWS